MRDRGRRRGRLQLGLRPAALHGAGGLVRHRPGGPHPHPGVPRHGGRAQRRRARAWSWTSSTTTPPTPGRPGATTSTGSCRATTTAANPVTGRRRDVDVLLEHRDRAHDDGQADGRLGADVDAGVQGRRVPLRPHGPPAQGGDGRAARAAGRADAPRSDGVDGRSVYLYGEGWDFGEVAGDARFVQATQANMAGTGIGTFNDRLRDAVRGGGPFDEDPRVQGFASGLLHRPERRRGQRRRGRPARPAAAVAGPDQGRAWPATSPTTRSSTAPARR